MSKLLFIFSDLESESIDAKDQNDAKHDIEIAIGGYMEDFYQGWTAHFGDSTTGDIFGFEEPEAIILAAEKWNLELRKHFTDAYVNYMRRWGHTMRSTCEDGLDNDELFKLRMATSAMDNHFSPAGNMFVYIQEDNVFQTVITEKMLAFIRENPEMCVLTIVSCT